MVLSKKKSIVLSFFTAIAISASASTPLWLRDAQISPDGKQIAFTYKGDIWVVPVAGGKAERLTSTESSYEQIPIWSPDSKNIAFSSDRNGSFDIYVMPTTGGKATRLTFNSAAEKPEAFTPDGKNVLFSASIQDPSESALFPSGELTEVYEVPVNGGKIKQILATPAQMISFIPNGKGKFLYQDLKGMENEWRKHHTSSVTRDIWLYNPDNKSHSKLTGSHAGEDRNPVAATEGNFFFLSERNGGSMNVYSASIENPEKIQAVTSFKNHPVRFLSRSNHGTLCYTYDGEIYTQTPSGKPNKVNIDIVTDEEDPTFKMSVARPSEMAVSPDGKAIAFISRGDVFVTSVDYTTTKQITSTPEAERYIAWGHDSKSLIYSSERDGNSNIFEATMAREDDPNFANATIINEKPLFKSDKHERMVPQISPDGKKLAFVLDRTKLAVMDLDSKKVKEITDGSTITRRNGNLYYTWSPDSKWIAMDVVGNKHDPYTDIAIVNVETQETVNLTNTGYFDENPRWVLDGNAIIFATDRYGMRSHASWGSMSDVMIVFLNQKAYDNYLLNKEDAELAEASDKADKDKSKEKDKDSKKDDDEKKVDDKTIEIDRDGIEKRTVRLTPFSSDLSDAFITADGETLFFITTGEENNTLWSKKMRGGDMDSKSISTGLRSFEASADGKTVFILGSTIQKFNTSSSKLTPVTYRADMKIDPAAEREYMFDYVTREEAQRFYTPDMHGVDWNTLTSHYRKFLPHINNNYDFAEMLSEMLGELNVSHTGSGYRSSKSGDRTASLGLLFDMNFDGKGLKISEIVKDGPFDNAKTKATVGCIIEKINDNEIAQTSDYTVLLNDIVGKKTLISIYNPQSGERWEEVVKPISSGAMSNLLYDRWVKNRAADVEEWSNGRLGYVHITSMNDESFRKVYTDLLGKYNQKEGVVIDIRRNGGGRLHEDIEVLFSGEKYLTQVVRGQDVCDMPSRRWNKPSIMVTCEACYSNAHGTPWVYKHRGLGKVVGMPVPGTMTSVNWVTMQDPSLYFGIPVVGYRTAEGFYLENHQLEPDIIVDNDPSRIVQGQDDQLHTAVMELLKEIDAQK